jgi:predicted PurR-regulated permease PerM
VDQAAPVHATRRFPTLIRFAVIAALIGGGVTFIVAAKHFVLPIVLAVLASFLLGPLVRVLVAIRIPRPVAAAKVVLNHFCTN